MISHGLVDINVNNSCNFIVKILVSVLFYREKNSIQDKIFNKTDFLVVVLNF